jgi:hypothetical protein
MSKKAMIKGGTVMPSRAFKAVGSISKTGPPYLIAKDISKDTNKTWVINPTTFMGLRN